MCHHFLTIYIQKKLYLKIILQKSYKIYFWHLKKVKNSLKTRFFPLKCAFFFLCLLFFSLPLSPLVPLVTINGSLYGSSSHLYIILYTYNISFFLFFVPPSLLNPLTPHLPPLLSYDTELMALCGDPICVSTLSSHCSGPCKWISIQHGVLVTSCRWYSAPQPFTKLIRIVHIFVSSYTASNPWLTDCDNSCANSWLLKIFSEQPGGILHTVLGWKPWWWLQLRLCTKIAESDKHSAYTSPPT